MSIKEELANQIPINKEASESLTLAPHSSTYTWENLFEPKQNPLRIPLIKLI